MKTEYLFVAMALHLCLAGQGHAQSVEDLAVILGNGSFEDDLVHSEWKATKKNNNYRIDAPVVNPSIVPEGDTTPLQAPAGFNFVGILATDAYTNGRLVHDALAGQFPRGTVFEVIVWANRGRLEGASSAAFPSDPSTCTVNFLGWGPGKLPTVNTNNQWSRSPIVDIRQGFTEWAANGQWAAQTFQFMSTSDLSYIALALNGTNHWKQAYVAFDVE